ncbi:hypothetical protein DPMN_125863 [Dreissena polymorpha]|uniref:Uncharacterized protein n=1 Tax=Dreissena polymorpha TaxID=45954 RepID=A0A9D4GVY6_DREPO|nr:hypothetical protein DPMN_125863 [Dreissena polymorpha]
MSRECHENSVCRPSSATLDILSTHDKSAGSQYDISRECRLSTLKSHDILSTFDILSTLNTIYRANIAQLSLVDLKNPRSTHDILSTLSRRATNQSTVNI